MAASPQRPPMKGAFSSPTMLSGGSSTPLWQSPVGGASQQQHIETENASDVLNVLSLDGDPFRALRYLPIKTVVRVSKMNRVGRRQDRLLIVTDTHMFSAIPAGGDVQRCLHLDAISECRIYRAKLEMACIVPTEYNFLVQFYEPQAMIHVLQCLKPTTKIIEESAPLDFHALHIDKPDNFNRAPLPIATLAFPVWRQKATFEELAAESGAARSGVGAAATTDAALSLESSVSSLRPAGRPARRSLRAEFGSSNAQGQSPDGKEDARWKSLPAIEVAPEPTEEDREDMEAHLGPSPKQQQPPQGSAPGDRRALEAPAAALLSNSLRLQSDTPGSAAPTAVATNAAFRAPVVRDLSSFEVDHLADDVGRRERYAVGMMQATPLSGGGGSGSLAAVQKAAQRTSRSAPAASQPQARGSALLRNVAASDAARPSFATFDEDGDDVPPPPPDSDEDNDDAGSYPTAGSPKGQQQQAPAGYRGPMPLRRKDGTINVELVAEKSELVHELRRKLQDEERKNAALANDMAELLACKREAEVSMQQEIDALRAEIERMSKEVLRFRRPWALDL